jgi:hypothetical protein
MGTIYGTLRLAAGRRHVCYRRIVLSVSEVKFAMAGHEELEKFMRKFVSLWQSGCNARLHVEAEAGNAFVSLGQAQHALGSGQHGGGCQGGSPSKQRRRERREAERSAKAAASAPEEAAASKEILEKENEVAEKSSKTDQKDEQSDKKESVKSEIEFKIQIDAHVKCKNYDVV